MLKHMSKDIKKKYLSEIINSIQGNIVKGVETLNPFLEENYRNVGDEILEAFQSKPDFIGQVNAETGEQNTFEQMKKDSIRCALWMQENDIQPNDVITICTHNQFNAYIPFLAALYIGAVVNMLDEHVVIGNLSYFLIKTKPKIIFIDEKFSAAIIKSVCDMMIANIDRPIVVTFGEGLYYKTLESILKDYDNPARINNFHCTKMTNMKETVMILFTPGTTAFPKYVEIPRSAFLAPPNQMAPYMKEHDIGLWFESLGFINGIFMTIQAIRSHVTIIKTKSKFHPENACKLIERHKVTWAFFQTSMCIQLINSNFIKKDDKSYNISSLRIVVFSGSPDNSRDKIHVSFKNLLPNTCIIQTYCLTETGIIAYQQQNVRQHSLKKSGCINLSKNVQLKIVSLENKDLLDPFEQGEIYCTSPYMMILKDKSITNDDGESNVNWFKTEDYGVCDKYGNIFVKGRINQLFEYKKYSITSMSIEMRLQKHLAVSEAVVVPVPFYPTCNKHPIAFVTKIPGKEVTEKELKELEKELKEFIVDKELRAGIIFLDQFPRIPNGKIYQKLLHDWAQNYIYEQEKI